MRKYSFLLLFMFCVLLLVNCAKEIEKLKLVAAPDEPYQLDIPVQLPNYTIPEDNPITKNGVELGRNLFYEKKLSVDNTISCGSCHVQSKGFADGQKVSIGVRNQTGKRSAMALANLIFLPKNFFWDGRSTGLEHQIIFPITDPLEMDEKIENVITKLNADKKYKQLFLNAYQTEEITQDKILKALAQFERTILSTNSKYDQYLQGKYILTASEERGKKLFYQHPDGNVPNTPRGGNCGDCHSGSLQTDNLLHNNGLDDTFTDLGKEQFTGLASDRAKFRTPSLRNIELTAPYMHDGRFATLEEVLDQYNDHVKYTQYTDPLMRASNFSGTLPQELGLLPSEKKDIINFLKTLTDTEFITNPKFAQP